MDKKALTKTALADALGVSRQCVHRYEKQGMPCISVDAARAWREHFLRPRVGSPRAPSTSWLIERAHAMQDAGAQLLESGNGTAFEALTPAIREALRAVPDSERERVGLRVTVIDALTAEQHEMLMPFEREVQHERKESGQTPSRMSDESCRQMGMFWYSIAAGDQRVRLPDGTA